MTSETPFAAEQGGRPVSVLLDAALADLDRGLCVLPAVRQGDKKGVPLKTWREFQFRLPSQDEVGAWFSSARDGGAMCLVCGVVSGNLEMIDFDLCGEAFDAWREAVNLAAPGLVGRLVIESTPSGGKHAVYRCDSAVSGNTKLAQRAIEAPDGEPLVVGGKTHVPRRDASGRWHVVVTMIETRGEGGLFLCAPSDGYAILQGDMCEPPLITADERDVLLGCACQLDELPKPMFGREHQSALASGALRPGDDYSARGDVRSVLIKHGWKLDKPADGVGNEHWCRPGKDSGTSATFNGSVFYVFSTNAQPFEAQVGYAPFGIYALLEHHGDFTAAARALRAEGFGQADAARGVDLSALMGTAQPPAVRPSAAAPLSVRALVAAHPNLRPAVIHGLLRKGETMNIIASPKTGKSWLTLDLAIAVATGRPWLTRFETAAGDVFIIDNELHPQTSADRIPKVAAARGVPMSEIDDRIFVDNVRGRLIDIHALDKYLSAFEPGRFKVIVIDAFYRIMPVGGDENDNGTMANIYNRLDAFADRLRCCFVLIHHSTKGSQSGKSVTDVGAGAGAQSRATDTHLVLRPHEESGVVVLDAAVRSWPPIEPACLRWSFPVWTVDGALDPLDLKPERPTKRKQAKGDEPPEAPEWTPAGFVDAFITVPRTRDEIVSDARECGLSIRQAKRLISVAVADGLVQQEPFNGKSAPRMAPIPAPDEAGDAP